MFKDEADFEKVVGRLNIDTEPNTAHRQKLRRQMLSVFNQTEQKPTNRIIVFRTLRRIIQYCPIISQIVTVGYSFHVLCFVNNLT